MVIRVITCDNDMHPFRRVVRELKLAEAKGILISMAEFVYQMYKARKAHGDKVILDDVTLSFYPGAKIGVVGPNGMGKSTLLKVMAGLEEVSAGDARLTPGYTVGILQQEPPLDEDKTVLENVQMAFADIIAKVERFNKIGEEMGEPDADFDALMDEMGKLQDEIDAANGWDLDSQLSQAMDALQCPDSDMPVNVLSGGERRRVALCRLLLEAPDLLLLDEPTNHLDLHAIEWLEQYLSTFKGTVVAISHDRYFLDRTITRVIEVLDGKAEFYSGNYSFYAVEKERRYLEKMRQYEKEQAKIAQLEKSAEQLRMFAFKGMDKTYRRALSMEKRIERMRTTDKPTKERALNVQFKSQEFYGDEVFALRKLKKSFGDRVLFHDVDLQVRGGERIALIGDNGTGKSTLIKMLMEEEYPDEGKIKFGPSVRTAYLPQIVTFDVPERNLVDTMLYSKRNITPQTARDRLAAFHFTGEDVFKSVSVLSGGELSRLKLCILMDEEVNLLILDEPTNHLDIASREWIEEAVESYDGTLLFVSHDRYFINRFATRVWELENGVITDYPMGFARYRQVKALEAQNKIDHTPKAIKEKTITEKLKPNRSAQQARRQLTICEKEISAQEAAIAEIEQRLEEAGSDYERYSEIYKEKEAAEETLGALMEKWETLAEQAGE